MLKRALTILLLATSLLIAACSGSGASGSPIIEPESPGSSLEASPEGSPDTMSPEASPDTMSPEASPS